jgi:nicotinate-nucleotide pyrophosphorylase (carboxylating)
VVQPLDVTAQLPLIRLALAEDLGAGDATSQALIDPQTQGAARLRSRERMVVAGLALVEAVYAELAPPVAWRRRVEDGQQVEAGDTLMELRGPVRTLLAGERVALNFLQRLSGVATLTSQFVARVQGTGVNILDTRKTTPGWRQLEKYAVRCGGGHNHRFGLFDQILIKDNHLAALAGETPNAVAAAVRRARDQCPELRIEVEADTLEQVGQAVAAGADIVLLDNMDPDLLRRAVALVGGRCETEASGGVTLDTVRGIAGTGVACISVGALTHSARSVDVGLDFDGPARQGVGT